jgi:hypothetical protein
MMSRAQMRSGGIVLAAPGIAAQLVGPERPIQFPRRGPHDSLSFESTWILALAVILVFSNPVPFTSGQPKKETIDDNQSPIDDSDFLACFVRNRVNFNLNPASRR